MICFYHIKRSQFGRFIMSQIQRSTAHFYNDKHKPKERYQHKMVYDGINTGYVFGGWNFNSVTYYSDLWSFKCMLMY